MSTVAAVGSAPSIHNLSRTPSGQVILDGHHDQAPISGPVGWCWPLDDGLGLTSMWVWVSEVDPDRAHAARTEAECRARLLATFLGWDV